MSDASTAHVINRIGQAARSGRLDEAAALAAQAKAERLNEPTLFALGGAIEFHRRQFAHAVDYLEEAIAHFPDDAVIRANLAESLYQIDEKQKALSLCQLDFAKGDPSLRLARLGGFLAQESGDYKQAVALYRHVVKSASSDWEAWNNLGNALRGDDDLESSVAALEHAVALAPEQRPACVNLANGLFEVGRVDEAEKRLMRLAEEDKNDPIPFLSLFAMYRATGREDEAYEAIKAAAAAAPSDASIQSDFGQEAARRNEYDDAEAAFEQAVRLDPRLGPPFVGLASVYERMNREDELTPLRDRANAAGADDETLAFIDALRFKRDGMLEAAFDALQRSGDVVVPGRKFHLRGAILDRLGRPGEAMEAFNEMNAHWRADPSQPTLRAKEYRDAVQHGMDILSPNWVSSWKPFNPPERQRAPIFLVGFPRSGTTLLDTMLMAEPNTLVLEEEPFIGEVERALGGVEALPDLDEGALLNAREQYFAMVAEQGALTADTIVVDKHPMHLNKAPTIARLFPDAQFVLILRHPCDVLLSCYLTNFRVNMAMANFLDIDDAATLYDMTFTHWEKARGILNFPVHTVVYERLVTDQHRELAPLFDGLGFSSLDQDFDHRKAARARGTVRTASYSQVTEPIYTRATGRWRRYREFLEPVLPKLEPWITRFGYGLDDDGVLPWGEPSPSISSAR